MQYRWISAADAVFYHSRNFFCLQIIPWSCHVRHIWRRRKARRPAAGVFIIVTFRRCRQRLALVKPCRWSLFNRVYWRTPCQRTTTTLPSTNPSFASIRNSNEISETNVEQRVFEPMKFLWQVHRPMYVGQREKVASTRRLKLVSRVPPMKMTMKLRRHPHAIHILAWLVTIPMSRLIVIRR